MKNVFLILVSLAFMSVAQAGPFGLKSGMTVEQMIEAGFEYDKKRYESIGGRILDDLYPELTLKGIKSKKNNSDSLRRVQGATNPKYPNIIFNFTISDLTGLSHVECRIHGEKIETISNESLEKLFQIYSEKLEKKYKTKPSEGDVEGTIKFSRFNLTSYDDDIRNIILTARVYDIPPKFRVDARTVAKNICISYTFLALNLHHKKEKLAKEKRLENERKVIENKIKSLLPKEEDL